MGSTQKKITVGLWVLVLIAVVGLVVGKTLLRKESAAVIEINVPERDVLLHDLFPAPPLTLTDQDGKAFSTGSLVGKVWVADFIFTSCGNICPMLSDRIAHLQQITPAGVNFVSFSVDPKNDTPTVLKAYGTRLGADFSRWHFLTGSTDQMIDAAIQMKIATSGSNPLSHSDRFLLIDSKGMVVATYSGVNASEMPQLAADATRLAAQATTRPQSGSTGKAE